MDFTKQSFPQVLTTWGEGALQNLFLFMGGFSQYMGEAWGTFKKR